MPTRYLKPGIRDSESIDKLSPLAETLFYRLLVTVDDFGRFDGRPSMIKAQCFPVKESVNAKKCDELLNEIHSVGLIVVYEVDGKPYLQLQKWDNKPRAVDSKFPAYEDTCIQLYTDENNPRTFLPLTETETVTKTETVTETKTAVASRLPPVGVSESTWQSFKQLRKAKRAPITQAAIEGLQREAEKAGWTLDAALAECCARGWQGFKADWVASKLPGSQINKQELLEASNRAVVDRLMDKEYLYGAT